MSDTVDNAEVQQLIIEATDTSRSADDRVGALTSLALLAFNKDGFAPYKVQYLLTLRSLGGDADAAVREAALTKLALGSDLQTQTLLIQGLQNPSSALVDPVLALQLLGRDVHSTALTVAYDLLANSTDPEVRAEATHLLAADPAAAPLLTALMADKTEHDSVRDAAAIGLKGLDPAAYIGAAHIIAVDKADSATMRVLTQTALDVLGEDIA